MFAGYTKKEFIQTAVNSIGMTITAYLSMVGMSVLFK